LGRKVRRAIVLVRRDDGLEGAGPLRFTRGVTSAGSCSLVADAALGARRADVHR